MSLIPAGSKLVASTLNTRVGTAIAATDTSTFTSTTATDTITVSLIAGRTYSVKWYGQLKSSVAGDCGSVRIREDSVSGTTMQLFQVGLPVANTAFGFTAYAEYTAAATASKTFVATAARLTGTGNFTRTASATAPSYLVVELIG